MYNTENTISFILSKKERERYEEFRKKHRECRSLVEVSFIPTGIGNIVKVKCNGCKKNKDITDVDSW